MAQNASNTPGGSTASIATIRELQERYKLEASTTGAYGETAPAVQFHGGFPIPVRLKAVHRDSEISVFNLSEPHSPTERSESEQSERSDVSQADDGRSHQRELTNGFGPDGGVLGDERLLGARWFRMRRRIGSF
ncbi:hypothetical protein BJ508DRAFT_321550 [Ascobolus immersus RN42]|uniref:Uncharacterized protein n=1 Tax=Ascobolus immersus RN42 TaxID=1160509 RepID=A0A3N4IKL5_ASCIM|nr:hypothetical protein BJ508DRAFT_321550 [Ascobolus immersus RN42]